MSKKFFIFIAIILVVFLLALVGYYFILQSNTNVSSGSPSVFKNFFPFGNSTATTNVPAGQTDTSTPNEQGNTPSVNFNVKLRNISHDPIAGFTIFDIQAGAVIRHMDKATGHIFETELFSPRQERISNTTLPQAYDAEWGSSPDTFIAQYLQDDDQTVSTYGLSLKQASTTGEDKYTLTGITFPEHITSFSVSGPSVFYLVDKIDSSTGVISSLTNTKKTEIWSSPIREALAQFVNSSTVALTTKPYQSIPGYLYFVNTSTGKTTKILGNIPGLSALTSPDAKKVLMLTQGAGISLSVYSVSDQSSTPISPSTFPEKCVWSKKDTNILYCAVPGITLSETSLTDWYMGRTSYSDDIWKYDLKNGTQSLIENLSSDSGEAIDLIRPTLDQNERYLVFINKADGSLWSLDLNK